MDKILSIEWDAVKEENVRVRLGNVGVDSASIAIGDKVSQNQIEIFTPEGDGSYAVYAQFLNGRKVIIIDFDACIYDDKINCIPDEGCCPQCGEEAYTGFQADGTSGGSCKNGHDWEVPHTVIEGLG